MIIKPEETITKAAIQIVIKSKVIIVLFCKFFINIGKYIIYCIEYLNRNWISSMEKSTTANLYYIDLSLSPNISNF